MMVAETVFGIVGATLFGISLYYCRCILNGLVEKQETTLAMFFLRPAVARAFKVLSISMAVFAAGMLLAGFALVYDQPVLTGFSKIGGVVSVLGVLYFMQTLAHETTV